MPGSRSRKTKPIRDRNCLDLAPEKNKPTRGKNCLDLARHGSRPTRNSSQEFVGILRNEIIWILGPMGTKQCEFVENLGQGPETSLPNRSPKQVHQAGPPNRSPKQVSQTGPRYVSDLFFFWSSECVQCYFFRRGGGGHADTYRVPEKLKILGRRGVSFYGFLHILGPRGQIGHIPCTKIRPRTVYQKN